MTPDERAERIRDLFCCESPVPDYLLPAIAVEIRQAVEEERRYWQEFMKLNHFESDGKEAKAEAYEKAASRLRFDGFPRSESQRGIDPRIAYGSGVADALAWAEEQIRALAAEEGK